MSSETTDITLFDLGNTGNICFSPNVWKVRMLLHYKGIPYKSKFLDFPDIEPHLKSLGVPARSDGIASYTLPTIHFASTGECLMDADKIAERLNKEHPTPELHVDTQENADFEAKTMAGIWRVFRGPVLTRETNILNDASKEFFLRTKQPRLGDLTKPTTDERAEELWQESQEPLEELAQTLKANGGPFIHGAQPSYSDFFLVGCIEMMRIVHRPTFERFCSFDSAFENIYEASQPWMQRND